MTESILLRKFKTIINNPKVVAIKFMYLVSPLIPDALYLKIIFYLNLGYKLNLKKPSTYNEKLQWLKIHYRKPVMTRMVDKYEAKEWAKQIIGERYIVKSYGVWNSFDDIDFNRLPDSFVLKTTHDQGGVVIVKDKANFDMKAAKRKLNQHLKVKHFYLSREWPYKNVEPRIMAEEHLENNEVGDLWDYKFYCFNGKPEIMYISHGRHSDVCYFDFFDMSFQKLDIYRRGYPKSNLVLDKPKEWELMKKLAEKLSSNLPHVRIDFYIANNQVFLGELTFFQGGGLMPFYPQEWDFRFGSMIDLSKVKEELVP